MKHQILIVEDDDLVSEYLVELLSGAGYETRSTDSAFGAAHLIRELRPAAVLLDIGLPYRPGTELLDELKSDQETADVPVVVISGLIESLSDERRALAAGVLGKPIDVERLLPLLDACVASRRETAPS